MSHSRPSSLLPLLGAVLTLLAAPSVGQNLTHKGKECRVKTDVKSRIAKPIVKRIDRYCAHFAAFYDRLGLKARNNNKAIVRIFASYDEFVDFTTRTTNLSSTPAAYFSPSLNGIVSYFDDTNPYLRQVLFHETSHQYMNRYTSDAPKWANEGLAEYFEGWRLAPDGTLIEKRPAFFDLLVVQEALEQEEALGLQELVEMEPERFMEFRENYPDKHYYLHYATAWSLVYYFLEGPSESDRARYVAFMKDLNKHNERAKPIQIDDWKAFEERWRTFVLALEVQAESLDDHLILASNLRKGSEWKKAVEEYEKILELDPEVAGTRYWLGYSHKRSGGYPAAREALLQAHEEDASDARPAYMLARIESGLDQKNPATVDYPLALGYAKTASARLDDKSAFHLAFVARLQHLGGDSRAAVKTVKKALKLVKREPEDVVEHYKDLLEEYGG